MPYSNRPGDVLADRYRLADLLTESRGARFWRAHDRILHRHVAVHVIDAADPRAPRLLEAARRSATVHDPRLLRVLDAETADGLCYVVNEWASGMSLDIMVAVNGPLSPRRAAWLVAEVADAIAVAHEAGVAHGRLIPENVLVDRSGSVRVIGFAVDAALHGLPPDQMATDVSDLAGLLHCALTAKWAGVSASAVAPAPQEHGRVLRPRQVRAGIPRLLDSLCDEVLNPYATGRTRDLSQLTSARGIADALFDFVGDPTGLAEEMAANNPAAHASETVVLPAVPEIPARSFEEPPAEPEPSIEPAPSVDHREPEVELPTQAGLPIFDDETDDVSWLVARSTPAAPPPPFEAPPVRPLFAPDPAAGQPVRRPRPGGATETGAQNGSDYWPWETGNNVSTGMSPVTRNDQEVPGRNFLRVALAIGAGLLLLVAFLVAYNLGRGKTPLGAEPDEQAPGTPSPSTAPALTPLTGLKAIDFDPQSDPPEENPELAPLAVDGDPATSWRTLTYDQNFGPGGLKTGVGLRIDLGSVTSVAEVDLILVGEPTDVSLYVTDAAPSGVRDLTAVESSTTGSRQSIVLDEPVSGRYLIVWLTSVPEAEGGFRGEIAEVSVRG